MGDQFEGEVWDLLSRIGYDHPCLFLCIVMFCHWWCSWCHVYWLLVVLLMYICVTLQSTGDVVFWHLC